jgi:glycine/D-amino acid oxidase-like deaminating enzyme
MARFPNFKVADVCEAVFEPRAGYLDVEDCVMAHCDVARKLGAELHTDVIVNSWEANGKNVLVSTSAGLFEAAKLVISAGPRASDFLHGLGIKLEVYRKDVYWYPVDDPSLRADQGCPAYLYELEHLKGVWYGIPMVDDWGFKIAEHTILPTKRPIHRPLLESRNIHDGEKKEIEAILSRWIPWVGRPLLHHDICFYTMSPDENFIVDVHPHYPQVSFAAGLSGHGFKFTCVLGEALADLTIQGNTQLPIGFLNCQRFKSE